MTHVDYLIHLGLEDLNDELTEMAGELLQIWQRIDEYNSQLARDLGCEIVTRIADLVKDRAGWLGVTYVEIDRLGQPIRNAITSHDISSTMVALKDTNCNVARDILEQNGGTYPGSIIRDYARQRFLVERYAQNSDIMRRVIMNARS